jgi:uncharacterized membrane protein
MITDVVLPAFVSALGLGLRPILDKKGLEYFNAFEYTFIRYLILGVLSLIIVAFYVPTLKKSISRESMKWVLSAVVVQLITWLMFFYSLSKTDNTLFVVLITYIVPIVLIAILGSIMLKEKMNDGMIGSIVIIVLGLISFGYYKSIN